MIKQAIIIGSGHGTKMWPYTKNRSKLMLKVANKEIVKYQVEYLTKLEVEKITIIADCFETQISRLFQDFSNVEVIKDKFGKGSANALLNVNINQEFVLLFGDCHIQFEDLKNLVLDNETHSLLLSEIDDNPHDWIACSIENENVNLFGGHHRGNTMTHRCVGLKSNQSLVDSCKFNPGFFDNLKVGVGSPNEYFLEVSINDLIRKGINFKAINCKYETIDCDKPWHYLLANAIEAKYLNSRILENLIDSSSVINPTSEINGFIKLGKNSMIGKNVIINGTCIIGDNTIIDNNVTIGKNCIIGNNVSIRNGVKIADCCVIGNDCRLDQTFELIGGVLMDHVYCVHYGEFYGCIGSNSDLGAGTTCGTLRFDDGESTHIIQGRKEIPTYYSNAIYIGDYARTGICALLMPGVKIGVNSIVGSGVLLNEDLEDDSIIQVQQNLIKKEWSNKKYGW